MKYITEDDLRSIYRKTPFTSYELEPGAKLTPAARQFLADRSITYIDVASAIEQKSAHIKITGALPCDFKENTYYIGAQSVHGADVIKAAGASSRDCNESPYYITKREKLLSGIKSIEGHIHELQMLLDEMKAELAAEDLRL